MQGATWGEDGTIYLALADPAFEIAKLLPGANQPQPVTRIDEEGGEAGHLWPQVLPGDKGLLFTIRSPSQRHDENRFAVVSLDSAEIQNVHAGGAYARYVRSGHLLYGLQGQVFAGPFDTETLEVTGPAQPVLDNVRMASSGEVSVVHLEVTTNGSMIYAEGYPVSAPRELVWVDRQGSVDPVVGEKRAYEAQALSPSGESIAVTIREGLNANLWVFDLVGQSFTRLTMEKDHYATIWSPDGRQLALASNRAGAFQVFVMAADGSGEARQLTQTRRGAFPGAWSPDGEEILVDQRTEDRSMDIWRVPLSGDTPQPLISSSRFDGTASFSPDGRWIAYVSSETRRPEIYVQAYPELGRKWQISQDGGSAPSWSRAGDEIFYWGGVSGRRWVSVAVKTSSGFRSG